MLIVVFFLVIAAVCAALDLPSFKGKAKRRDLLVTGVLWICGLAATICTVLQIEVPSPLLLIIFIYKPINELVGLLF
ncbi:hypothetical protein [Paenibacillus sp. MMS20-IR301]|uniref:hypothetical protein n=1 Tax=Paenibacillus sp. MMS20-IR301 TaxID=2895946 RepID=UPI0028E88768|nr:hypothetical protein [Paenibacillus sp. MMS20-IR301]WNS44905.1 hypothetical protein LOS79_06440 [Paenibacillus sp. MMS20-IR301]